MITALNYAAKAEKSIREFSINVLKKKSEKDYKSVSLFLKLFENAQHFALPDGGKIIDDQLKGIENTEVRLPYQAITVEYYIDRNENENAPQKVVVYAFEIDLSNGQFSFIKEGLNSQNIDVNYAIDIYSAWEIDNEWILLPGNLIVPSLSETEYMKNHCIQQNKNTDSKPLFMGSMLINTPWLFELMYGGPESDKILYERAHSNLSTSARAVLELLEALSCSNVKAVPRNKVDHSKNRRRIKKGKLPIYETKILTIEVPNSAAKQSIRTGTKKNSPRQHLRRGHIRRLSSGKNVWINACVVGSTEIGVIDKSYNVRE